MIQSTDVLKVSLLTKYRIWSRRPHLFQALAFFFQLLLLLCFTLRLRYVAVLVNTVCVRNNTAHTTTRHCIFIIIDVWLHVFFFLLLCEYCFDAFMFRWAEWIFLFVIFNTYACRNELPAFCFVWIWKIASAFGMKNIR